MMHSDDNGDTWQIYQICDELHAYCRNWEMRYYFTNEPDTWFVAVESEEWRVKGGADIGDDPQQPGLERAASILVQVAISFDERVLRRILCSVAVAQDSVRQIEGEALVSQDQLVEGR